MTTKSKLLLAFGLLFFGMLTFIIGSAAVMFFVIIPNAGKRAVELNKKRSAETFGMITSVSEYRSSGDKYRGSSVSKTYSYQYAVNGVKFNAKQSSGGGDSRVEDKSGLKVKVCYDPAEPQSSAFYNLNYNKTCGQ